MSTNPRACCSHPKDQVRHQRLWRHATQLAFDSVYSLPGAPSSFFSEDLTLCIHRCTTCGPNKGNATTGPLFLTAATSQGPYAHSLNPALRRRQYISRLFGLFSSSTSTQHRCFSIPSSSPHPSAPRPFSPPLCLWLLRTANASSGAFESVSWSDHFVHAPCRGLPLLSPRKLYTPTRAFGVSMKSCTMI